MNQLKDVQKRLMAFLIIYVVSVLCIVSLFETGVVGSGAMADNHQLQFILLSVMELITICVIPLALWMFRARFIHRQLLDDKAPALLKWGLIRMHMLVLPMLANTLLYYLTMSAAFGYMAIILFLCLAFINPSMARCVAETSSPTSED